MMLMSTTILTTKLYIPPPRPNLVRRPHLWARLTEGLHRKLTLVSAPAGFGKTTLISSWIDSLRADAASQDLIPDRPSTSDSSVAWLSLDKQDSDPVRFLTYLVAALQRIDPDLGSSALDLLQSPQPPPIEPLLTTLINQVAAVPEQFVLVLDDYHEISDRAVDNVLAFLLEHLPPQMHLVMTTRADPQLPLARYRARGQLTELRAGDLRFTPAEAANFLKRVTGVSLAAEEVAALERRTEGWIVGLQMAALALQGTLATQRQQDVSRFVQSFTGSHRFVMDYLAEEVLQQQPDAVRRFLLRTSILDRMCADLCDQVLDIGDWGLALSPTNPQYPIYSNC
jgi:LuxR family maltose regulon positive regulatory protein